MILIVKIVIELTVNLEKTTKLRFLTILFKLYIYKNDKKKTQTMF